MSKYSAEYWDHRRDLAKHEPRPSDLTPQQRADELLAEHQASRPLPDKLGSVLELCGCVQGLILTDCIPHYMVDYLKSRVERVRRAHGLPSVDLIGAKDLQR